VIVASLLTSQTDLGIGEINVFQFVVSFVHQHVIDVADYNFRACWAVCSYSFIISVDCKFLHN
jgi:hypothetical protein